jgi:hypothetical protein
VGGAGSTEPAQGGAGLDEVAGPPAQRTAQDPEEPQEAVRPNTLYKPHSSYRRHHGHSQKQEPKYHHFTSDVSATDSDSIIGLPNHTATPPQHPSLPHEIRSNQLWPSTPAPVRKLGLLGVAGQGSWQWMWMWGGLKGSLLVVVLLGAGNWRSARQRTSKSRAVG